MLEKIVKKVSGTVGYGIVRNSFPPDMEEQFQVIYEQCKKYTVTSVERMYALYKATQYIVKNKVPGDIVECGVWKGGSSMLCALTLKAFGETQKKIYLYDTYSGMTKPTEKDIDYKGTKAINKWKTFNKWCTVPLEETRKAMYSTGYPRTNILFIKGKVEDTIPSTMPKKTALLRLDTDWYESTYHEMVHLFPGLSSGGVLIIDDYGHFRGVKEAVDKYFSENTIKMFLNRIDYTGRIGIKETREDEPGYTYTRQAS